MNNALIAIPLALMAALTLSWQAPDGDVVVSTLRVSIYTRMEGEREVVEMELKTLGLPLPPTVVSLDELAFGPLPEKGKLPRSLESLPSQIRLLVGGDVEGVDSRVFAALAYFPESDSGTTPTLESRAAGAAYANMYLQMHIWSVLNNHGELVGFSSWGHENQPEGKVDTYVFRSAK
jgi:hypothetical protein